MGPSGGALVTTEVVTSDLGTHGGLQLRGRVQRRTVRLALGSRLRASAVRLRPLGVEVREADGAAGVRVIPIATPPDPLLQLAQGVAVLWIASMVIRGVAARMRRGSR